MMICILLTLLTLSLFPVNSDDLQGIYSGLYNEGTYLLMIKHIDEIPSTNHSKIFPSRASAKLMFLGDDYHRYTHAWWWGIYDQYNKTILLSNYNFSYNIRYHNTSFMEHKNKSGFQGMQSLLCPEILVINNITGIGNLSSCKYNISLSSLSFTPLETFRHKANSYGTISLGAVSIIFYFLFKQHEYSQMMGRVVKISFCTVYLQFIYNGIICFLHFDAAMNIEILFTTFLIITFICIMNANLYQRMMRGIWAMRYSSQANIHNEKVLNFLKIFSFIIILFLSQYALIGTYNYFIYLILLSDWTFQVIHNIKSGHTHSWKLSVVIFMTLSKLFFPLYIYGCPYNIINNDTNYFFCFVMIMWSTIQILVLYSMDYKVNSRWFIPEHMKPLRYKYHKTPNYDVDDVENNDDDDDDDEDEDEDENIDTYDDGIIENETAKQCSICLENINWKKEYKYIMVTPCYHYFHDQCLTTWMQQRLTCPTCRQQLPPYI